MARPDFVATDPRNNPLMADVLNASPATSLVLETGEVDEDNWPIMADFFIGLIVEHAGRAWRVIGFTTDNDVVIAPHGLGHDALIRSMVVRSPGLRTMREAAPVLRHRSGLIAFG